MKITFDWLQDHLKTNFKEKHLLEQLTNIGLEVESVGSLSADNETFKIAKIVKTEKIYAIVKNILEINKFDKYLISNVNSKNIEPKPEKKVIRTGIRISITGDTKCKLWRTVVPAKLGGYVSTRLP